MNKEAVQEVDSPKIVDGELVIRETANTVEILSDRSVNARIHKHVDACSFQFRNNTGQCIPSGTRIVVGDLVGFTTVQIPAVNDMTSGFDFSNIVHENNLGGCGTAQLCGPQVMGYRAYLPEGIASDICLGDRVIIDGRDVGVAIHSFRPGLTGTNPDVLPNGGGNGDLVGGITAVAGATCVYFLCIAPSGGGNTGPATPPDIIVFNQNTVPAVPPLVSTTGAPVMSIEIDLTPAAGTTTDVNTILNGLNKTNLPDGYTVKFNNFGAGELVFTNPTTGNAQPNITTDGFACFRCVNGAWRFGS